MRLSHKLVIFSLIILVLAGCQTHAKTTATYDTIHSEQENKEKVPERGTLNQVENDELAKAVAGEVNQDGITVVADPDSPLVIVNKDRMLPEGYEPTDLVIPNVPFQAVNEERKHLRLPAAEALEELFAAAEEAGVELVAVSGFRRYETQEFLYNYSVEQNGEEYANKYSAQPGHSEHQTGLAMDVSTASIAFRLVEEFEETPEGQWIEENAHQYGFVVRYPKGKSEITGYNYEPWHLRYVGEEVATEIAEQNMTIETYFGLVE